MHSKRRYMRSEAPPHHRSPPSDAANASITNNPIPLSPINCVRSNLNTPVIILCWIQIDKAEAVFATLPREREEFEVYSDTIAQQTARVEAEIVALKERLVVERAIRLQREEYEALAKLVNKYPAKAQTTVGQTKVAAEIAALEEEKGRLGKAVAMRKRQLSFVLNAVRDLKNGLEYDMRTDEEKERFLAEQAAAVAKCKEEGGEMEGEGDEDEEDEESEMQMD